MAIQNFSQGEQQLCVAKISYIQVFLPILIGILLLFPYGIGIIVLIFTIPAIIRIATTKVSFTNKRFHGKTGLINTKEMSTPLSKLQNITVSRNIWGLIFGYGTLKVESTSGVYCFTYVKNAHEFRDNLMNAIMSNEEK